MNLNLTSTAPVRFSIPERFALQKKENIKEAAICSPGPSLHAAPAQKFRGSRAFPAGAEPRAGDGQHLGVTPPPSAFEAPPCTRWVDLF